MEGCGYSTRPPGPWRSDHGNAAAVWLSLWKERVALGELATVTGQCCHPFPANLPGPAVASASEAAVTSHSPAHPAAGTPRRPGNRSLGHVLASPPTMFPLAVAAASPLAEHGSTSCGPGPCPPAGASPSPGSTAPPEVGLLRAWLSSASATAVTGQQTREGAAASHIPNQVLCSWPHAYHFPRVHNGAAEAPASSAGRTGRCDAG